MHKNICIYIHAMCGVPGFTINKKSLDFIQKMTLAKPLKGYQDFGIHWHGDINKTMATWVISASLSALNLLCQEGGCFVAIRGSFNKVNWIQNKMTVRADVDDVEHFELELEYFEFTCFCIFFLAPGLCRSQLEQLPKVSANGRRVDPVSVGWFWMSLIDPYAQQTCN